MHDIDRTQLESEQDFEFESEFGEEVVEEIEELESPFSEAEEMEMAADLLEVTDEAELDQFLGKLVGRAWGGIKKFARSRAGRAVGGVLKGVAKKALPVLGTAAGTFFGGPVGGAIGGKLASAAGRMFGLELEGLSQEDQEFEVARRFVRFAGAAAKKAAKAPPTADPAKVAKAATIAAARRHAPGLLSLRGVTQGCPSTITPGVKGRSGRWIRRGRRIILLDV